MCLPPNLPATELLSWDIFPIPFQALMATTSHLVKFSRQQQPKSIVRRAKSKAPKEKSLPFYPSVQHVKNTEMMLMCDECSMWRLIYSKQKLKSAEKFQLERALDGLSFSSGAQLQDADIPEHLKDTVFVRRMSCKEPIEKIVVFSKVYRYLPSAACERAGLSNRFCPSLLSVVFKKN